LRLEVSVETRERAAHLDRRPRRAHRVVLMSDRDPKNRHHRITGELLHLPTMPFEHRSHRLVPARQHPANQLRIEPLTQRSRVDYI
jgi:hypothetical protein